MVSFPRPDNAAPNVVQKFKQLLQWEKFPEDLSVLLNDTVYYRLSAMRLATQYIAFLDVEFTDGFGLWHRALALPGRGHKIVQIQTDPWSHNGHQIIRPTVWTSVSLILPFITSPY